MYFTENKKLFNGFSRNITDIVNNAIEIFRLPLSNREKEQKYSNLIDTSASSLRKLYDENVKKYENDMYKFFCLYIYSFYGIMYYKIQDNNMSEIYDKTLINLFHSVLTKYESMLFLINKDQLTSAFSLFRMLYENIIITDFLTINKGCINSYLDFAFYKTAYAKQNIVPISQETLDRISIIQDKYGNNLLGDYGWSNTVLSKENITFDDISQFIIKRLKMEQMNKYVDEFLEVSSKIMHSNCDLFDDDITRKVLTMDIQRFMYSFCIFLIIQTFIHIFYDEYNKLEMNIFMRISDIILAPTKWNIERFETMWGTKHGA
jgi:hypothetical protein